MYDKSKLQMKEHPKENWNDISQSSNSEGSNPSSALCKKRASCAETVLDSAKKIKMDPNKINSNRSNNKKTSSNKNQDDKTKKSYDVNKSNDSSSNTNNNVVNTHNDNNNCNEKTDESCKNNDLLEIQLGLEKQRKSIPFIIRDVKVIISEYDCRNNKWKETFSKYRFPARWGVPIVKDCNEKWDGRQIPPKLLMRYQKYLLSKNLTHPIFLPKQSLVALKLNENPKDSSFPFISGSERESENNNAERNENEIALADSKDKKNKLKKSSSVSNNKMKMVLRSRNHNKFVSMGSPENDLDADYEDEGKDDKDHDDHHGDDDNDDDGDGVGDDDDDDDDDNDDGVNDDCNNDNVDKFQGNKSASNNDKCKIKQKGTHKKKTTMVSNSTVSESQSYESIKRNSIPIFDDFLVKNSVSHLKTFAHPCPDSDSESVVCPICNLKFTKQLIESHATECAFQTFKD